MPQSSSTMSSTRRSNQRQPRWLLPTMMIASVGVGTVLHIIRSNARQGTFLQTLVQSRQLRFDQDVVVSSIIMTSIWNKNVTSEFTNQPSLPMTIPSTTGPATVVNVKKKNHHPPIVVDPLALKRGIRRFLRQQQQQQQQQQQHGIQHDENTTSNDSLIWWTLLEQYHVYNNNTNNTTTQDQGLHFYHADHHLSLDSVCSIPPGQGIELDAGYNLLTKKVTLVPSTSDIVGNNQQKRPKLLCMMYTYSPMRYLTRVQAVTWGRHCDGFVAFSNETIPDLGIFQWNAAASPVNTTSIIKNDTQQHLVEPPPPALQQDEAYQNMWQKTRYMWKYAYDHFLDDYDYFYISGDDVYLLIDNFRAFLQELHDHDSANSNTNPNSTTTTTTIPRHFGSWLPNRDMIAGGPGYTLNRPALQKWIESTSRYGWKKCFANRRDSKEDWFISRCMTGLGIHGHATETRDPATGEQRFHDACPATIYSFRADPNSRAYFKRQAAAWESQPSPSNASNLVGPKHGLDAAAKYSISFHRIRYPIYTARIHVLLHTSHAIWNGHKLPTCPTDSNLTQGLFQRLTV
ncbi:hypothetical protein IV203_007753 [Nitzschia inconspicua]|uniref:Uncharacterized protein n=1 Tax=Nitzschia inconspicua TaxID=303405 RepID=A0A9K3KZ07_9STRA|nr:hypothetical protein IV203_007753 [Nitzschia inconspicua]